MLLIPIQSRRIEQGDDLVSCLAEAKNLNEDILIISSKVISISEGNVIDLSQIKVSDEAKKLSIASGRSETFAQAVLDECTQKNGHVLSTCPQAIVTELRPDGMNTGTIITANAGLDESNIQKRFAVGWPKDPAASAKSLREKLNVGAVLISDSTVTPRREGVTAFALAVSGLDPVRDDTNTSDLFGKKLQITHEAIADQLATAANMLMGNGDQSIPAVLIREHGFPLSNFEGWVPGIEPEEDLFQM
jgi:coenzyme F420-0:L-glutamate ligase/coenzyme F420-1:gamma-L-glutamate ligase